MSTRSTSKPKSPRKPKATDPKIVKMPKQKMAVVVSHGDPNVVAPSVFPALYGSVYTLKFDLKKAGKETFKVGPPRARWPALVDTPKEEWTGIWGIPIPSNTRKLPQKVPGVEVKIETWDYGTVAEILHIGPYSEETPTIERLREFVEASGYEIAGAHEEEYLTKPEAKVVKTLIRYPVRRRGG